MVIQPRFATVAGLYQQVLTLRCGLRQAVGASMLARLVFMFEQGLDMGRNFNLQPFIKLRGWVASPS